MVGLRMAFFMSLLTHISCASSRATRCPCSPEMLTAKPPLLRLSRIISGNCSISARYQFLVGGPIKGFK